MVDTAGGESSSVDGERTEWSVSPEITYIEVLQEGNGDDEELLDRYYGVKYDWQIKDSANPGREGLNHFEITLLNIDEKVEVGKNAVAIIVVLFAGSVASFVAAIRTRDR